MGQKIIKNTASFPEDTEDAPPIQPLTAEEAQRLREKYPPVSPWRVVAGQAVVGVLVALAAWGFTGKQNIGWSALYGALSVVIPAAVFARGLTGRFASSNAGNAAVGFMVWELVKICLALALLALAPKVVPGLNWLALLAGVILATKMYWVALAFTRRPSRRN